MHFAMKWGTVQFIYIGKHCIVLQSLKQFGLLYSVEECILFCSVKQFRLLYREKQCRVLKSVEPCSFLQSVEQ